MYQDGVILIVDDNPARVLRLSHSLNKAGFAVRVAVDRDSAIEQAKFELPKLILLDIQMPGTDGFKTCRQLQIDPITRNIPIICLTASNIYNKVKGLSLGAVDYIAKPFHADEVVARVNVHLKLQLLSQQVVEQTLALQEANQKLEALSHLDDLTQIASRRRFNEYIDEEWRRLIRAQAPLSLILCSVDYFKEYTETYGQAAGDACLKQIAQVLSRCVKRPADLVARYSEAQFAIILPSTSSAGAMQVAKVIGLEIQQLNLVHSHSQASDYVTVSLGVSSQIPVQTASVKELIAAADQALAQAKAQGGNTHFLDRGASYLLNSA